MPTLTAESRLDNIKESVLSFVDAQVRVTLGHNVYTVHSLRPSTPPVRWVDVHAQPLSAQTDVMESGEDRRAIIREYLLDLNCFERKDAIGTADADLYTLDAMVDDIRQLFQPKTGTITIRDYKTVGDPIVGALRPRSFPEVTEIPTPVDEGMTQLNIRVAMTYAEESID